MQKTFRSFIKNGKERTNVVFFWKERVPNPATDFVAFYFSKSVTVQTF